MSFSFEFSLLCLTLPCLSRYVACRDDTGYCIGHASAGGPTKTITCLLHTLHLSPPYEASSECLNGHRRNCLDAHNTYKFQRLPIGPNSSVRICMAINARPESIPLRLFRQGIPLRGIIDALNTGASLTAGILRRAKRSLCLTHLTA